MSAIHFSLQKVSRSLRFVLPCYLYLFFAPDFPEGIPFMPFLCAVAVVLSVADVKGGRKYGWLGVAPALALFPLSFGTKLYVECALTPPASRLDLCRYIHPR